MTYNRQILRIALPSIVSNITVPLLGLIDVSITGHMGGASYVGAIAVGGMLFNIIYWLFAFLRMGTSGMTAQALGARDMQEVVGVLQKAVTVALVFSTLLLCVQYPIRELALMMIEASPEVTGLARTYFDICVWGAPPSLLLFALNGWFLGMQNSRAPMVTAIVQNVSNIVLSLVFVYVCGWRIEGVAMGTLMAQYVGLVTALALLSRYRKLFGYCRRNLSGMRQFFRLNSDIFFRTLCLIAVHFYFVSAGARFGDSALAVNALIMQLFLLYSYFMDGFAFAGEALVGKAIGARDTRSLKVIVRQLFGWGVAIMVLFTVCYALSDMQILSILTDEASVLETAEEYYWWAVLLPVCGMAAFIWDGIYIGATATRGMLISLIVGMAVFFSLFEIFSPTLGNHALWLAFNVYLFVRGASQTVLYSKFEV